MPRPGACQARDIREMNHPQGIRLFTLLLEIELLMNSTESIRLPSVWTETPKRLATSHDFYGGTCRVNEQLLLLVHRIESVVRLGKTVT
jgi:hypothetical protein